VILFVAEPGKSHAVNAALRLTRGDLVAFTDDDVRPDPEWLAGLARGIEDTGADFVAGRILPTWEITPPTWMSPSLYGVLAIPDNGVARLSITSDGPSNVMPIGANMAVRASVIARLGGLRTDLGKLEGSLRTGEDHEFFLRLLHAGCRGTYEPSALVRHLVPASRLDRGYFRRWLLQNGGDVARLERAAARPSHSCSASPLSVEARALDAATTVRAAQGHHAQRFASRPRDLVRRLSSRVVVRPRRRRPSRVGTGRGPMRSPDLQRQRPAPRRSTSCWRSTSASGSC
jgi:cellulose synthase/poly-beta-1,6-N-acetylglucosamine synthase-like glycosyltransferase